jgi:hypothetical protein
MKPFKIANVYVYVVYEFPSKHNKSGHIHGVYINASEAVGKENDILINNPHIKELAVLKKPLHGKSRAGETISFGGDYVLVRD